MKAASAPGHCHWGAAPAQLGHRDQAIAHLSEALRLNPNYTQAKDQLDALAAGENKKGAGVIQRL